jgi:hypothetical protein
VAENQITALQSANLIECGLADDGVAGDHWSVAIAGCVGFQRRRRYRGRAYVRPTAAPSAAWT